MSDIFGGSFNIAIESGLDNTTFLSNANSVGDSFSILDTQLTITNTSGLLLDPATHTLSEQLNFLALNTDSGLNGQYATIANLNDATTAIGLRLDTAEQGISEHTNLINDNTTAINNHLTDSTAHDATQIYFLSSGGTTATRGFFLSGEGTTDSVYNITLDTFTPTNAFKPDTLSVNPIAFNNKIFVFSSDAGGSFVSTDGGLNFTALTTPWNINNLVTSCDVGEYTASGTFALLLGMSSGEIYYTLDGINFVLETTTFSNQILALKWSNYAEWDFVVHNDTTLHAFDWTGVSNGWIYANMPIEPTSIGYDVNGPIISSSAGTYLYDWQTETWTASNLLGSLKVFFSHSGSNSGDYYTIAVTESGALYTSFITNNVADAYTLVNTIVEAGTVTSLTQYDVGKYLVTFGPALNSLHQIVWFEYPFTFFHYQVGVTPVVRNLTGGCNAVYASQLPASLNVVINSGTVTCDNADEVIRNLNTSNTELRAANYITSSSLTPYRTASAQDTIDSGKYSTSNPSNYIDSSALTPYRTSSAQDTIDSGKYPTSNPDGFITNNALTPYRTSSVQDTIDSSKLDVTTAANTYQTQANMVNYYPTSNPDNFVTLSAANSAYKSISSFNSDIANYRTASAQDVITGYLSRNIRVVDSIHGVSAPVLGQAYSSINAALTAFGGGTIFLYPGTHVITNTIQPIANVSFLGADKKTTFIQMTATTNISMFLINAANISFQNLTINMISSSAVDLKMFEITANNNSFHIDNCICNIKQTSTGASNIYQIHDTGNEAMTADALFHIFEMVGLINTTATGTVRNIYKAPTSGTGADLHIESSQFYTNSGICVETAGAFSPELSITNCFIQGATADISQTTGRITLGKGTILYSALSNNLPFNFFGTTQNWQFGDDGQLPGGTNYLYRGTATSSATLIPYRINKPTVICNLYTSQRTAPGGAQTVTFTVMKNGVATLLTCVTTGAALNSNNITNAVQFAAGDLLAIRTVNSGGTSADVQVQIDLY